MAGLTIYCPFCGQRAGIRTTEKLSLLATKARIYWRFMWIAPKRTTGRKPKKKPCRKKALTR